MFHAGNGNPRSVLVLKRNGDAAFVCVPGRVPERLLGMDLARLAAVVLQVCKPPTAGSAGQRNTLYYWMSCSLRRVC
jgi:hypothetical protein